MSDEFNGKLVTGKQSCYELTFHRLGMPRIFH
jgi:hypothetical protein